MRSILPLRRPEWSRHGDALRSTPIVVADARQPPRLSVLRAIAAAGLATAGCALGLALANDDVSGLQIALLEWISIPYIAAGLVAWWRRPDSRLGVLMIAGGFATARLRTGVRRLRRSPHDRAGLRHPARRHLPARLPRVSRWTPALALRALARRGRVHVRDRAPAPEDGARRRGAEQRARGLDPAGRRADRGEHPARLDQRDLPRRDRRARQRGGDAPAGRCGDRWRS